MNGTRDKRISGAIFQDVYEGVIIRNNTGQGWGIPLSHVTSEDLRVLADWLQNKRMESGEKDVDLYNPL